MAPPAVSKAQAESATAALAVKRGEADARNLSPSARRMLKMTEKQLHEFAKTGRSRLPERKGK
jgi:hypothetical protein